MTFKVKFDGSALTIKQLYNPQIESKVNETVKWWRAINLKHGISFLSQTDVQKKQSVPEDASPVSMPAFNVMRYLNTNIFNDLRHPQNKLKIAV